MDFKSMQTAVADLSTAVDVKMAGFSAQIEELKNAFSTAPARVDDAELKAFMDYARTGQKASRTDTAHNAQEVAIPRYTAIFEKMRADNQILQIVNTMNVTGFTGASIPVDVNEPAVNVVGEGSVVSETSPSIDIKNISLAKYIAKVGLTYEMMNATEVEDFYAYVSRQVSDAMGRKIADDVTSNILNDSSLPTVNSASAGKVATDDLMDMMGAVVDKANNNGKFVMNSATYYALAKAVGKDASWFTMPYSQGISPSMFGHEVVFDSAMPDVASGNVAIAYGDFNHAVTRIQANGIQTTRDDISGADNGIVYLRTYCLTNSALIRPESIVGLKVQ